MICSTCISSADPRLKDIRFKHVLIDEATQAIEPECLLPMLKGAKHVIKLIVQILEIHNIKIGYISWRSQATWTSSNLERNRKGRTK